MPELDLLAVARGSVVAAAGCGKTHLIAETVGVHPRGLPVLVLTHTNAGKSALELRLRRLGVPTDAFRVKTIDGWALRLIGAFPQRSGHDPAILNLAQPKRDYPAIRRAAETLLLSGAITVPLKATFAGVLVDEYQDCSREQHGLVVAVAATLPTRVLGDPLQAIFGFGDVQLVHWGTDVTGQFPHVGELARPHRWNNAGHPDLGAWLLRVRGHLLAGEPIDLRDVPSEVRWVHLNDANAEAQRGAAAQTAARSGDVLIIGDSNNPRGQREVASRTPGAQAVESVELADLVSFGQTFDVSAPDALDGLVQFASSTMTNVGAAEYLRRVESLRAGTARKPATASEQAALSFREAPTHAAAAEVLRALEHRTEVRVYRPDLLRRCSNALQAAEAGVAFPEATRRERERYRQSGRRLSRRAVGSTLLLKGLEAEVAVVLNPEGMNASNLYVALTRASARLVICSREPTLYPT